MTTIYILPIEPIDQRYTKQWYIHIPEILEREITKKNLDITVKTIDGKQIKSGTTSGAFLDFGATNIYKATQVEAVSELFSKGEIKPGDKFLVTDAWNFAITPIKYMSELLDIPVEIHSIWHAGAYDPTDILGYKMSKPWPWHMEQGWYYASDYNYYASESHRTMFLNNLNIDPAYHNRAIRSGQPHDHIVKAFNELQPQQKENKVMWPHRLNSDKQPEIADDLSNSFNVIKTQSLGLAKDDYYKMMASCKVLFSCALHENLGISMMEGCLAGAIPVVPDRCSYKEIYLPEFKYPSEWTENYDSYVRNKDKLVEFINERINNYDNYKELMATQQEIIKKDFFSAEIMVNKLLS